MATSESDTTPRGIAQLSQGTLTDKALAELARIEELFLAECVKLRERRGSWDRLAVLFEAMDALSAELATLCRVLGLLSAWVPQERDGEPTLAILDGDFIDPGTTSLWKWPTLRESIGFLEDQRVLSWTEYKALAEADRKNAFSIPQEKKLETLRTLKGALVDSFARGESVESFTKTAKTIVTAQTHAIERMYRTKSKQAYLQGVEVLTRSPRVRDRFPWVKYVATQDNRTRPTHRAMDGKIVRAGSPEHDEFLRLQSEYNCRCTLTPLTDAMARRNGVDVPEDLESPKRPTISNDRSELEQEERWRRSQEEDAVEAWRARKSPVDFRSADSGREVAKAFSGRVVERDGVAYKIAAKGKEAMTDREVKIQKEAAKAGLSPKIHDVEKEDGKIVKVAMDYVNAKPASVETTERDGVRFGAKPLQSVLKLNELGVAHGDLHGRNVRWLDNEKRAVLLDFEMATRDKSSAEQEAARTLRTFIQVNRSKANAGQLAAIDGLESLLKESPSKWGGTVWKLPTEHMPLARRLLENWNDGL